MDMSFAMTKIKVRLHKCGVGLQQSDNKGSLNFSPVG